MLVFDRLPSADTRRVNWMARRTSLLTTVEARSVNWQTSPPLNQDTFGCLICGHYGSCTGFSAVHYMTASPWRRSLMSPYDGHALYHEARTLDEWQGEEYEGSSVNGACLAMRSRGWIKSFYWVSTASEISRALQLGPVMMGTNWYQGMMRPNGNNMIKVDGEVVGGHAYLIVGFLRQRNVFTVFNSWGPDWGRKGRAEISFDDVNRLLREAGDAVIGVGKAK
jgi:hypothetical protein